MTAEGQLRQAIVDLWADDAAVRAGAAGTLTTLAFDMTDIRSAQPALTVALVDPDPEVRRAVLAAVEIRADLGADVGMAVPALFTLAEDPDAEVRASAWRGLFFANRRLGDDRLRCVEPAVRAACADPDPRVRRHAGDILRSWAA